jgi:hypothetical protein
MKYVWRIAFLALILIPMAHAHAEATTVVKNASDLRAFNNLDARLAQLDSYSVVFVSGDKHEVIKSAPARHVRKDGLTVELRKHKHKHKQA